MRSNSASNCATQPKAAARPFSDLGRGAGHLGLGLLELRGGLRGALVRVLDRLLLLGDRVLAPGLLAVHDEQARLRLIRDARLEGFQRRDHACDVTGAWAV